MKYISTLILALTFFCQSSFYSQTNFQYALFKKNHPLRAEDLKVVQKDGKTSWTVKTTLTNRSKDTLFYFSSTCSESFYYSADTLALHVEAKKCDTDKQTVIAIPPSGQRTVTLEIAPQYPLTSSIEFHVIMFIYKAKNMLERIPYENLVRQRDRKTLIVSNQIKT